MERRIFLRGLGGAYAVNVEDGSPTLTKGNSELYCREGGTDQVDGLSRLNGTDPGEFSALRANV